ncbi:hypothetical protein IUY40_16890 [Flavobacterium sp. ALJ2]|uniref:DUF5977 domain-containing protein n=1 Tax=Flavobacterium sp. ALJ2 TaxID=2786960 RepID=UPI0018A01B5B|nr:DUF5977 domain-containing protein [Flavobacterium sp. ALJ2]MBF7093211.1 hypothetical protein [Flavobacterium sp. ALJ2]
MGNTGYKSFEKLELYFTDDGSYAGVKKPNIVTDPDYIAPILDTETCAPSIRFYNSERKRSAIKNNCSAGYSGNYVTLTAFPNQFISTIDEADANTQAEAWLAANVQIYANSAGTCERIKSPLNIQVTKSVIFTKQASIWTNCKSANLADSYSETNNFLGAAKSSSNYYLNRYRGIIDTSMITTKPISAKIKFKFTTNTIGSALTINLFASNTKIPINQAFQLSDWNDWDTSSFINSVIVPANSTAYNEISLTQNQIDLLYKEQSYNFFIISNGDKENNPPGTNNRPVLSISKTTGTIILECKF